MLDNFKQIQNLLRWDTPDDFYFLQVIKRRKENPGLPKDMKLIDTFILGSEKEFTKFTPMIKECAQINNARAYIWVNRRSFKKCALLALKKIATLCSSEDYRPVYRAYHSACGESHSEPNKKWIVDLDGELSQTPHIDEIEGTIKSLQTSSKRTPFIERVPTLNGIHLISSPFDLKKFRSSIGSKTIDVHKDSPTLIFFEGNNL